MKRRHLLMAGALALAGCAANAPPQPASALQLPSGWRAQAVGAPAATGAHVEQLWWQAFGDPVLSDLVGEALARNGDLRVARARVQEYRARLAQADANRAPNLAFDGSPTRTRTLASSGKPYVTNVFQAELQASYEIDVWGRLASLSDAAGESYRAEQASLDAAALSIAASVATSYLNLRGLDAQLELTQSTLQLREQSRELARKQFEVGYSSRLEWLQAQSEYHVSYTHL
ncbi:outer membrane protein OprM precursor, partial [Janthinobacterium sp. HH100]|uniref:TolC family protein n=1 Tax=Janthinobacterium sp. HH100 TaxID=1537272 RepID=UPI000893FCDC